MTLIELLDTSQDIVITESIESIHRVNLKHYTLGGPDTTKQKLETLYNIVHQCVKAKNLIPIIAYIDGMAEKRFESGFELQEIQIAINILEESIWKQILEKLPLEEQPKALSLVSSIIGSGKDKLARSYVTMTQDQNQIDTPIQNIPPEDQNIEE